jgi:hypothetical protein
MADLIRHRVSQRTRKLRPYIVGILVLIAGALCVSHPYLQAAPITFRFDAEIINVPVGNPFDLPLTYQVGDVIHGRFTFEPALALPIGDNAIAADQNFALEFEINGTLVSSSGFRIEVFNDTAFTDSEFPEQIDVMSIGCNEASCIPNLLSLPEGEPFRVRSRMQLVGSSSILSTPEISADPATWNLFTLERRLILGFDDIGPGSMGLDAIVGPIVLVPEPSSLVHVVVLGGIVGAIYVALRCLKLWQSKFIR